MIDEIVDIFQNSKSCVILTGAGISAESGVPTFRGKEGLWGKFKPEELATMDAFVANSKIVWEWYNWRRELMNKVKPNPGHYAITDLEALCSKFTLVTQNVDGLHFMANTKNILELHGNIYRNKCCDCSKIVESDIEIDPDKIPKCEYCGGKIRPDVVWFGEMLDPNIINSAFEESEYADLFFSIGTSGIIHPAASLPAIAKRSGAVLVEINMEKTPLTYIADYHINSKSGEYLPKLVDILKKRKAPV
jgi:NAD-dependent deacetylase